MAKGKNDDLIINLGVALDKLQIDNVVQELKSILETENKKGKLELKAKYDAKDIENIKQIRDKIVEIEEKAENIKVPQNLKRDMEMLKMETLALKNNINNVIKEIGNIGKKDKNGISEFVNAIESMNKAIKRYRIEYDKVNQETQKQIQVVKEKQNVENQTSKETLKNKKDEVAATKEQINIEKELAKAKEKTANAEKKGKEKIKTPAQTKQTKQTKTPSPLQGYINNYKNSKNVLETKIVDAQQYKGRLQAIGIQGLEGNTREAQENVYKAVNALQEMGRQLEAVTGKSLTNFEEILTFVEQNVAEKGQTISSILKDNNLEQIIITLNNKLLGSKSSITTNITHVQENVEQTAEKIGISLEEMLIHLPELIGLDDKLKVYYGFPDKTGKSTEITSKEQYQALLQQADFDPKKLKVWLQSDTVNYEAMVKTINDANTALKEYESLWKQIIALTEQLGDSENAEKYKQQIDDLKVKAEELRKSFEKAYSTEGFDKIQKQYSQKEGFINTKREQEKIQEVEKAYLNMYAKLQSEKQKYETNVNKGNRNVDFENTEEGKQMVALVEQQAKALQDVYQDATKAKEAVTRLQEAYRNSGKPQQSGMAAENSVLKEYKKNLEQVVKLEKDIELQKYNAKSQSLLLSPDQKATYAQITRELEKQQQALKERNEKIKEAYPHLVEEFEIIDKEEDEQRKLAKLQSKVSEGGRNALGQRFKDAFGRIFDYTISYKLITGATNLLRSGYRYLYEYDEALTNLRIVTGGTREETEKLMVTYNKLGQTLGATTTEVAEAANDWLRQGYSAAESSELITASVRLSKLGMIETSEATQYLTSALKGYQLQVNDVIGVVDKLTAVDLEAAVSAGDLAVAMSRTASSAKMAGVDQNTLLGYLTVVQEVTQKSAETVGESFKSMFARFGNIKVGKFVDNDTGEALNDVEKALNALGIQLRSDNDTFREIDDVLADIAGRWKDFTDVEKNAIATAAAGTRQRENFIVLMENFGKAVQYAGTAANSTGTSLKKMQAYTDSLEGSVNTLKASLQELWTSIADSKVLINIVKSLNSLVQKLNELDWDKITEFLKVAAGIAAVALALKTILGIVSSIAGVVSVFQGVAAGTATMAAAIAALGGLGSVLIPVVGIIGAIIAALAIASGALGNHIKKIENLQKEIDKLNDKEKEEIKLFKQYQELMSKSKIYNLTAQEKENLKTISEQLVDTYGLEASGIDKVTGAYILNNKALEDNIEKLRQQKHELLQAQKTERNAEIKKQLKSNLKSANNNMEWIRNYYSDIYRENYMKAAEEYTQWLKQFDGKEPGTLQLPSDMSQTRFYRLRNQKQLELLSKYNLSGHLYRTDDFNSEFELFTAQTYLEHMEKEANNYIKKQLDTAKLIQENIISELGEQISANVETFFIDVSQEYIATNVFDKASQEKVEEELTNFLKDNKEIIENYVKESSKIDERLISEDVTLQDYQNYFNNEAQKLALLKKMFGEKNETYQKYFSTLETKRSSDLGFQFLDISTILSNAGDATTQFNTLSNSLIQLKTQFENGKISFNQYISDMNKATEKLKLSEIFGQNTEAAGKFLDSLSQHGIQNLDYLTDQFNNGSIEAKDYVKNLGELAIYFTQLNTAASSFLGSNYDSTGINDALTDIQTKLEGLENTLPTLTMSFTDFSKMSVKQVNDLAKALDALGIKTAEINGKTITGAKNIVKEAQKSSQGMQDLQATVAEAGSQLLYDFGIVAGNIVSKIANYISSFTLTLPSLQSIIAQVGSSLWTGKDVKINASVESNGIDVSSADFKKAIDAYAVKESGLGFRKENGGFTEAWDQAKQTAYNQIVKDAYADVQQNANNAIKYTLPYDLMQTGKNLFSNLNILDKSTSGNNDDIEEYDGGGNTSVSEYEKYYSKLYQDLLEAILKDKQQAIKDFEEKNDKLDKDLDHALELKNINNAKGIYQNIRKNQQEYEDELKEQIKWTETQINQVLIPRINQLAPQFAISSIDELTNEQEQIIKNYYEAELETINKDIFLLEKILDENVTEANKKLYIAQLSNTDLAKNAKQSKQLKEDQKNDLEYKQTELNTTISNTRTAQDWDKSLKESLKESQRDISAYKKTLEGMYDIKSSLIEKQVKKLALAPNEALKSYKELFDYLKSEFYPRSIEEAEYYANRLDTLLSEDLDRNKDYMNQMYQYAGTIKDYEVSLLEAQIDEYDEQINKLQEKKDLLKDNNALIEAETRLRNAQREKNKRVYREGLGFVWEADQEELKEAREALEEAKIDKEIKDLEKEKKAVQDNIDKWEKWYKSVTSDYKRVEFEFAKMQVDMVGGLEEIYDNVENNIKGWSKLSDAIAGVHQAEEKYYNYDPEKEKQQWEEKDNLGKYNLASQNYNQALAQVQNEKEYLRYLINNSNNEGEIAWAQQQLQAMEDMEKAIKNGDETALKEIRNNLDPDIENIMSQLYSTFQIQQEAFKQLTTYQQQMLAYEEQILKQQQITELDSDVTTSIKKSSSGGSGRAVSVAKDVGSKLGLDTSSVSSAISSFNSMSPSKQASVMTSVASIAKNLSGSSSAAKPDGYANGTTGIGNNELALVGENGAELQVLPRGTGILPNPITENLWKFGSNPVAYLDSLDLVSLSTRKGTKSQISNSTTNNIDIGNISLPNVTNAKQFVQELKLTVQRTKNLI